MRYKVTAVVIFIGFVLLFYFQDRYAISYNDDWNYAFIVNDDYDNFQSAADDNVTRQPVTSLYDAIVSQTRDYLKTNGRFIVHTTVQYLCGTKTMQEFIIINTIVFAIFLLLFIKLININHHHIRNILLALSSIWILLPHKGITFLGNITCSVNYLWACTITLLFLIIYKWSLKQNKCNPIVFIMAIIYAMIAGSIQESFSLGVAGALFIYLICNNKKVNKQTTFISLAYMIGTLVCMITPANFRRFDDIEGIGFHSHSLLGLLSSPPFILFIVSIIILCLKGKLLEVYKDNFIIFTSIIINLAFILFIAYNGRHQLTAINVFCLIFIIRIWLIYAHEKYIIASVVLLTTITIVSYIPILTIRKDYYDSYMTIIQRIKQSKNGIVSGTEFESKTEEIERNRFIECNYIDAFSFADWDFYERSLSIYLTKGKDNKLVKEIVK